MIFRICSACIQKGYTPDVYGPTITEKEEGCDLCGGIDQLYKFDNEDVFLTPGFANDQAVSWQKKIEEEKERERQKKQAEEILNFERWKARIYLEIRASVRLGLMAIEINLPYKGTGHPVVKKLLEHFKDWKAEYKKYEHTDHWRLAVRWGNSNLPPNERREGEGRDKGNHHGRDSRRSR